MAPMRITLKLEEEDVGHLVALMKQAIQAAGKLAEPEICAAANATIDRVRNSAAPDYVLQRIDDLEFATQLLGDADWHLPPSVRPRVITALTYFANPVDLIEDSVPGLGFLDDTIMIEVLTRELRHEIAGYRDFVRYRAHAQRRGAAKLSEEVLAKRLAGRRKQLRARIQGRQNREEDRTPSAIRRLFKAR